MDGYCLSKSEDNFNWFVSFLGRETVTWMSKKLLLHHMEWQINIRKTFETGGSGDNFTLAVQLECTQGEVKGGIRGSIGIGVMSVKCKEDPAFQFGRDMTGLSFRNNQANLTEATFSCRGWQACDCFRNDSVLLKVNLKLELPDSMDCAVRRRRKFLHSSFMEEWEGLRALGPILYEEGLEPEILLVAGDGTEHRAHKVLLRAYSPVLRVMLGSGSGMTESRSGRVEVRDLGGEELELLVKFMYDGNSFLQQLESSDEISIINLLSAAEKYQLKSLKELVVLELVRFFTPSSAIRLRKLMQQFSVDSELIAEAGVFCVENMEAVVNETSLWPEDNTI